MIIRNARELKQKARQLKAESWALYLAARHPLTPWYAKLLVAAIVAYAFSPIDLIPDFVPILGYLDDLILIPLGISLAIRLIPSSVLMECRARAREVNERPVNRLAGAVIVVMWLLAAAFCGVWIYNKLIPADHSRFKRTGSGNETESALNLDRAAFFARRTGHPANQAF
jgi:uncharacterized membrane protein YkvA (DUF1232 family)